MTSSKRNALPALVGTEEIADHLGVTVRHVRRLVAEENVSPATATHARDLHDGLWRDPVAVRTAALRVAQ